MVTASIGRFLLLLGLVVAAVGALLWAGGGLLPLGRLPGDILVRRDGFTLYVPLATGLVVSLLLTLILNLVLSLRAR